MHSGSFGKRFVKGKKRVSGEFSTALSKISAKRSLVRQCIGMYLSDFLHLFTIHKISELSTFNRSRSSVLFICYYNGNTRLDNVKSMLKLLIRDLIKSQIISCSFDFNSCLP